MATLPKKVLGVADVWNKYHYKLFVYLIEAKGLKGVDKDGTCDPLCKITLGKVTHKSKVLKKTTDPQFSELFFFVDPEDPICRVEVWDNKKGKFLGQCDIVHLETVLSEKVHDLWFDLQSRPNKKKKDDVSGRVHCRILVSKVFETRNGEEITYKAFFQHHLGQYKTGDLIVYSGIGLLPATTKVLTGCPYSHVGLVVELPNRWTKIPELYVVEIFRNPENFLSVHNGFGFSLFFIVYSLFFFFILYSFSLFFILFLYSFSLIFHLLFSLFLNQKTKNIIKKTKQAMKSRCSVLLNVSINFMGLKFGMYLSNRQWTRLVLPEFLILCKLSQLFFFFFPPSRNSIFFPSY